MTTKRSIMVALVIAALAAVGAVVLSQDSGPVHAVQRAVDVVTNKTNSEREAREPLALPLDVPSIEVKKSERRLILYSDGEPVREYRVGLGFSPEGDKSEEGDGRTPEGKYYICVKNPNSKFHLAVGLSYPNVEDAERGLLAGLIDRREYDEIVSAVQSQRKPPQHTALGGDIFIHGDGSGSDWTLGCIALDNADIEEIYEAVALGTPVAILP
jgi:murein L,D-transpeptidase YafK